MEVPLKGRGLVQRSRVFYGWWVVAGGAVSVALVSGVYNFGFSAFVLPITTDFGISRGALSLMVAVGGLLQGGPVSPIVGMLVDRHGARVMTFLGMTLLGLGFLLLSTAHGVAQLYVYYLLFMALGIGLGSIMPAYAAAARWFVRRRGTVFGIINAGFGLGAVVVLGIGLMIDHVGWRRAAVVIAVCVFTIGWSSAFVMRRSPQEFGLLPDGDRSPGAAKATPGGVAREVDFTARETLSTRAFWLMHVSFICRQVVWSGVTLHFVPAMVDKGLSEVTGAALIGAFGIMSVPSRLIFGTLGDRFQKRRLLSALAGLTAVSLLTFVWAAGLWQVVLFVLLYAIAQGGTAPLMLAITGEYFGGRSFGTIMGLSSMVMVVGTLGGPIIAGFLHDLTGDYDLTFYIFAAFSALGTVVIWFVTRPRLARLSGAV